jgi:anaerobic selenocysteine-containing dehydrogenase
MISGFFVATIVQTRHLPPWKSSALALLWGKEPGNNQLSTTKQIKARGKQAEVQLVYEGTSWRVKESCALI